MVSFPKYEKVLVLPKYEKAGRSPIRVTQNRCILNQLKLIKNANIFGGVTHKNMRIANGKAA